MCREVKEHTIVIKVKAKSMKMRTIFPDALAHVSYMSAIWTAIYPQPELCLAICANSKKVDDAIEDNACSDDCSNRYVVPPICEHKIQC